MSKKTKVYIILDAENRLHGAFDGTKEGKIKAQEYCAKIQKTCNSKLKVKIKA